MRQIIVSLNGISNNEDKNIGWQSNNVTATSWWKDTYKLETETKNKGSVYTELNRGYF